MKIVIGGIKGGTGKSTVAFHLATYAHEQKKQIATYDFDSPQFSFSRYYENRKKNNNTSTWEKHHAITNFENIPDMPNDMINIIDLPGRFDQNVLELHKTADIIITPINDSFVDVDTIMQVEQEKWKNPGSYYEIIFENKKAKPHSQWIIIRNRSSSINSKNKKLIEEKLMDLSKRLNFKLLNGLKERTVFKELFTSGQTVFDLKRKSLPVSQIAAKMEIKLLWKEISQYL